MAKDWKAEQLRDHSPTRTAAENMHIQRETEAHERMIDALQYNINIVESALAQLGSVSLFDTDADLVTAIRSLGAYQAVLKHKLAKENAA